MCLEEYRRDGCVIFSRQRVITISVTSPQYPAAYGATCQSRKARHDLAILDAAAVFGVRLACSNESLVSRGSWMTFSALKGHPVGDRGGCIGVVWVG